MVYILESIANAPYHLKNSVYIIRRTCRCDWRSQKLGVHWASQSSSFWPTKIRNTSAPLRRLANGTRTENLKRILCPVLWTTWLNGTVRMTFRKEWTSQKVCSRNCFSNSYYYILLILLVRFFISFAPNHLNDIIFYTYFD